MLRLLKACFIKNIIIKVPQEKKQKLNFNI